MSTRKLGIVAAVVSLVVSGLACKGGEASQTSAGESCPPLKITVGGSPVAVPHGFAVRTARPNGFQIELYNHDKVTCDAMLKSSRTVEPGETEVRVLASDDGSYNVIGVDAYTHAAVEAQIVKKGAAPNDDVAICVPKEVTFTPNAGTAKDKAVTVQGLFQGKFCGERK